MEMKKLSSRTLPVRRAEAEINLSFLFYTIAFKHVILGRESVVIEWFL